MVKRRDFLKGMGSASLFTGVGLGATYGAGIPEQTGAAPATIAAADPDNDAQLPIHAAGVFRVAYEPLEDGTYLAERTFRSPALRERYGDPLFRYEPIELSASAVPPSVTDGESLERRTRTRKVIGTHEEHRNAERRLHESREGTTADDDCPPNLTERIPRYHYESEAKASEAKDGQAERRAPINVCWVGVESFGTHDAATPLERVVFEMQNPRADGYIDDADRDDRWKRSAVGAVGESVGRTPGVLKRKLPWWEGTRHHIYDDVADETKTFGGDVAKSLGWCPMRQYHVRLYELDRETPTVIGQAHEDPCDHNNSSNWNEDGFFASRLNTVSEKISEFHDEKREETDGVLGVQNPWNFVAAANEAANFWEKASEFEVTRDCEVGNTVKTPPDPETDDDPTEFPTHDGNVRYIRHASVD